MDRAEGAIELQKIIKCGENIETNENKFSSSLRVNETITRRQREQKY